MHGPLAHGRTLGSTLVLAALGCLAVLLAGVGGTRQAEARSGPQCFGAAAMDREKPCVDDRLRLVVRPRPEDALLVPDGPCTPSASLPAVPELCEFGVPSAVATGTIALLGDSHVAHWRAAADAVARAKRWHGVSLARSGCPFSAQLLGSFEPVRGKCLPWFDAVPGWFAAHPEVTTVLLSGHSGTSFLVPNGTSVFEAKVRGATEAIERLPASVEDVVILRDTPIERVTTKDCVEAAIARRVPAGRACSLPRSSVLRPDALATAARRMDSPRVRVVDLTSFMCSARSCPPVVGGALVRKDTHHLTAAFSLSLGPYLQRALARLKVRPRCPAVRASAC